jgi:hypothetical protein
MCVRCASLVLKATAHELQVYGWVWASSGVSSMIAVKLYWNAEEVGERKVRGKL